MINGETMVRRGGRVIAQRASGALVLLNVESGQYYALNAVGARLWELCGEPQSVKAVAAALSQEYEAPLETIRADLVELLEELAGEKLVALESGAAAPGPAPRP